MSNSQTKRIQIKKGVYHLSSETSLGGMEVTIIREESGYFLVELDKCLFGTGEKTRITLPWSALCWSKSDADE